MPNVSYLAKYLLRILCFEMLNVVHLSLYWYRMVGTNVRAGNRFQGLVVNPTCIQIHERMEQIKTTKSRHLMLVVH